MFRFSNNLCYNLTSAYCNSTRTSIRTAILLFSYPAHLYTSCVKMHQHSGCQCHQQSRQSIKWWPQFACKIVHLQYCIKHFCLTVIILPLTRNNSQFDKRYTPPTPGKLAFLVRVYDFTLQNHIKFNRNVIYFYLSHFFFFFFFLRNHGQSDACVILKYQWKKF